MRSRERAAGAGGRTGARRPPRSGGAALIARAPLAGALAAALASAPIVSRGAPEEPPPPVRTSAEARYGPEPDLSPPPTSLERDAAEAARTVLSRGGRAPATSSALARAARELARRAADAGAAAMDPDAVRGALARGLSYDPAPAAVLRAGDASRAVDALLAAMPRAPATHLGVGAVERDGKAWVVLLASERRARIDPFPRDVAPGTEAVLSGELARGLRSARVFVSLPSGDVRELGPGGGRRGFRVRIRFDAPGRYGVEVVADGPGGPEVAALLAVSSGGADLAPARSAPAEPDADGPTAEARVLAALNATRRRHHLSPLAPDARLAEVARRHSANMLARGVVAHVLPGSGSPRDRLARARIPYRVALENVASAASALEAHAAIEHSPAHLANVLSREASRVGIGVASGRGATSSVYLTEIFVAPPDDGADSPLTPDARVREALWRERARLGRPPLTADPRLDALAAEAARAMRDRGEPDPGDLRERALTGGRRTVAAVDVFVANGPADAARSKNLPDPRFRRVGVGVATGDSARFGAGRLFLAVVYTD